MERAREKWLEYVEQLWAAEKRPRYGDVFAYFFVRQYRKWVKISRRNLTRWKSKNPGLYKAIVEESHDVFA